MKYTQILVILNIFILTLSCAKRRTATDYSRLASEEGDVEPTFDARQGDEDHLYMDDEYLPIAADSQSESVKSVPGERFTALFRDEKPIVLVFLSKKVTISQKYYETIEGLAGNPLYAEKMRFAVVTPDSFPTYFPFSYVNDAEDKVLIKEFGVGTTYPAIGILSLSPDANITFSKLYRPKAEEIEKVILQPLANDKLNIKSKTSNVIIGRLYKKFDEVPTVYFFNLFGCIKCKLYHPIMNALAIKYANKKDKVKFAIFGGGPYPYLREAFANFKIDILSGGPEALTTTREKVSPCDEKVARERASVVYGPICVLIKKDGEYKALTATMAVPAGAVESSIVLPLLKK